MVKFSKELEAQLIPEWKEAFVNYWQLKKQIKKIKLSQKPKQPQQILDHEFALSIFDPICSLAKNITNKLFHSDTKTEIIQVRSKSMEDGDEEVYQTELVQLFTEEDEVRVFFERLDEELNKVNQFYKTKESEFLERGEILNKQLEILLDLKRILNERRRKPKAGVLSRSWSSSPRNSDFSESASESNEAPADSETDEIMAALEKNGINFVNSATRGKTKKGKPKMAMRIDIPATTPTRTITAVTSMLWEDLVNNPKKKLIEYGGFHENIEEIRQVLDCSHNDDVIPVRKPQGCRRLIKVSNQQTSASYLKAVKRSHFISSDKVVRLMDDVESIFTKHFANNDRKRAMKFLRPQQQKESHMIFNGQETVLTTNPANGNKPHRCLVEQLKEKPPCTALKHRDAFLICTTFMTSVVAAMVIHLLLRASGFSPSQVDAIPGILLLVLMVDFFMADQLTSQIPLLRHMESTTCYFLAGSFKTHRYETCNSGKLYRELAYVISFLPYYWRAMQCARRWFDESDLNHLANMGKYVSAMVAAGARITYSRQENHLWLGIVLVTSVFATVYQLYWDFVKDWGLLNSKSKNLWLRDELILKNKSIYYMSIALNVVLRVAWVETVMGFRFNMVESRMLDFFLASLEVIRRGHWNFYRLENEHLNNVGKFRAVKAVPLPFRETDSDG
ncbi:unnamed protein product [Dovyalis caffra]|uniref:Phosphate transporter PHO1 n=1 Tax=Dovyalis caffra TaxID=77055 RepID=A0AAV1QZW8_9ROSI|nr:unnamed protein product [Dovyalis caffra]